MQGWGLDMKRDLVRVQGRVLPPMKIVVQNDEILPEQTGDFTMGLRNSKYSKIFSILSSFAKGLKKQLNFQNKCYLLSL